MSYVTQGLFAGVTSTQQSAATKPSVSPEREQTETQPDPSVHLSLRVEQVSSATYAPPPSIPKQPEDWKPDAVSEQMQSNLAKEVRHKNAFEHLTHMLFNKIASGADSFEQSISRFRTPLKQGGYAEQWVGGVRTASSNTPSQKLSFTLTTRSGATIRFDLTDQTSFGRTTEDSLTAKVSIKGDLSDAERAALGEMASLMERLSGDFMRTGKVSLGQLQGFDSSLFSELKLDFSGNNNKYSLKLQESQNERSLSINWNGNKVDLTLDLQGNLLISAEAKAQALEHYLDLIRESVNKSDGSPDLANFMADSFLTLHSLNEKEPTNGGAEKDQLPNNTLLSGLQDFNAQFTSKITKPNDHSEKHFEQQGFNLELSQKTNLVGQLPIELSLEQEQHYSLSASFYRPLWMLEVPDFKTQSYQYVEIEEQSSRRTLQRYEMGQWMSAVHGEQSSYKHRITEYQLGEITRDDTKEDAWQKLSDLTEEVKQKTDSRQYLSLLENMLITAPTKRSRV
ncbi:MAG: hypothetical protein JXQ97_00030 [Natronospirillum sp.]